MMAVSEQQVLCTKIHLLTKDIKKSIVQMVRYLYYYYVTDKTVLYNGFFVMLSTAGSINNTERMSFLVEPELFLLQLKHHQNFNRMS